MPFYYFFFLFIQTITIAPKDNTATADNVAIIITLLLSPVLTSGNGSGFGGSGILFGTSSSLQVNIQSTFPSTFPLY